MASIAALVTASPAGAGSLRADPAGDRADYRVNAAEVNDVTLTFDGTQYIFSDTAGVELVSEFYVPIEGEPPPPPPSGPCSQIDATSVSCPASVGSWGLDLAIRGGDVSPNSFRYAGAPPPVLPPDYAEFLSVYGGAGSDTISGSPAIDRLSAAAYLRDVDGTSPNTVSGGGGDDFVDGDAGPDELRAGPGDDSIDGGDGPDAIFGDDGNDSVRGGPGRGPDGVELNGDDVVRGGAGDDRINGWYGNDKLYGEAGKDEVEGGPGDDLSDGGPGKDGLASSFHGSGCPGGRDTFVGGPGRDSVYDYCGAPVFRLKDGQRDDVKCAGGTKPVSAKRDRVDRFTGKPCRKYNPKRRRKK